MRAKVEDFMILDRQAIHVAMLFWGGIFCALAALYLLIAKNYDFKKRKWLFAMELTTAALLLNDALAWAVRGDKTVVGYYSVRISNFFVFLLSDILLLSFHQYICQVLKISENKGTAVRRRSVAAISILGVCLVIMSQFNHMYYYFDGDNFYHRNRGYIISMILPILGMCLDFSLLVQFRKNISKKMLIAVSSYIILPLLTGVIQTFYYGMSLVNISVCISMLLMYAIAVGEQNEEIDQLSRKQEVTAKQLEVTTTLNRCIMELTSNVDISTAIDNLLIVINDYFHSDRCYICEIDYEKHIVVNTYEYARSGLGSPGKRKICRRCPLRQ